MMQLSWFYNYLYFALANQGQKSYFGFLLVAFLLYLIISSIVNPLIAAFGVAKQMHRIPCTKCCFFTNDYRLKCTIRPKIANTESAINCRDYQAHS